MGKTEIINALIIAHISVTTGKPMTAAEHADAVVALKAVRLRFDHVEVYDAVKAGSKLCVAA